jgi:pimeloyl-ACP methyl ester carboxylesterase
MSGAKWERAWRAAGLLRTLATETPVDAAAFESTIELGTVHLRRYASQAAGPVLILIHGVTARGADDRRLVRLARVLARHGVTCLLPQLNGLAAFRETAADLDAIERAIEYGCTASARPVSVLGFSVGGGYGLVCAASSRCVSSVANVTAIGAHHRLDEVWTDIHEKLECLRDNAEAAGPDILYCALASALRNLDQARLGTAAWETLRHLFLNFCDGPDIASVRRFVGECLFPHWSCVTALEVTESAAFSPAGKLACIEAPVDLLHAPDDALVSQTHAERNLIGLQRRVHGNQSLLVTPLLNHVKPRLGTSWYQIPALVERFAALLP